MHDKTAKIEAELHQVLKLYAAQQGRTLQDVTEELLRDGLQKRGIEIVGGTDSDKGAGGSCPNVESISKPE